jgi:hypothetical protein
MFHNPVVATPVTPLSDNAVETAEHSETKVILLWTYWFDKQFWFFDAEGASPFKGCVESRCIFTSSRSRFNESSIVLMHSRNLNERDLPRFRFPNQNFMFFSMEAPGNARVTDPSGYEGVFNSTATYMDTSAVRAKYGGTLLRTVPEKIENYAYTKDKGVLWFVSNCETQSSRIRQQFVNKLKQYINIDIYGLCGQPDPCNFDKACLRELKSRYRFYLSLENSLCPDYITEKFWVALMNKMVPVVMGASLEEYQRVAPPNSFIHVSQFSSARKLAEYLTFLTHDNDAYNNYMAWRQSYTIESDSYRKHVACQLCSLAHEKGFHQEAFSLGDWWDEDRLCTNSWEMK